MNLVQIFTVSALACSTTAIAQKTDLQKDGLLGRVRAVRNFDNETGKDGKVVKHLASMVLYNENGAISGKTTYNPSSNDEEAVGDDSYYYKNGRLWKIEYSSNFKVNTLEEYKYNSNNQLVEIDTKQLTRDPMGLSGPDKNEYYAYDDRGNRTEEKTVFPEKRSTTIFRYSFDALNRKTGLVQEKDGRVYGILEYEYDKKGQLVKETSKAGDNKEIYSITSYEYDAAGHMTLSELKGGDGKVYNTSRMKYRQNQVVEKTVEEDGTTKKYTTEFTPDKTGNWINKKEYKNGVKWLDSDREISYY